MPTATADPDTATSATVKAAYARLRALRHGQDAGWYRYEAGRWYLGGQSSCLLRFPGRTPLAGRRPQLYRDEVEWGLIGAADGHGRGDEMLQVLRDARTHVPALATIDDAAERLGVTESVVELRITQRVLYPLYGNRQAGRYFFATQLAALTTGGVHETRWGRLVEQLPPQLDYVDLDDWAGPGLGVDPLPIPTGRTEVTRRLMALTVGHDQGWFAYRHGDLARRNGQYLLHVDQADGKPVERLVPAEGVLPYVYGFGLARSRSRLVAYRPGLG